MAVPRSLRARRHNGTYYYAGSVRVASSCGHKHATARAALECCGREFLHFPGVTVFEATNGMLPAKPHNWQALAPRPGAPAAIAARTVN